MTRLAHFLEILALLSVAAVIIGMFGRWHFLPDLASHFRIQATGALLGAASYFGCSSVGLRQLRACWLELPWQRHSSRSSGAVGDQASNSYRLLTINVLTDNPRKDAVINFILKQDPDFVLLQETDRKWIETLDRRLATGWPFSKKVPTRRQLRHCDVQQTSVVQM